MGISVHFSRKPMNQGPWPPSSASLDLPQAELCWKSTMRLGKKNRCVRRRRVTWQLIIWAAPAPNFADRWFYNVRGEDRDLLTAEYLALDYMHGMSPLFSSDAPETSQGQDDGDGSTKDDSGYADPGDASAWSGYKTADKVPGSQKHAKLQVGGLAAGFNTYTCFTWEQDDSYCFALTDAPVQTLPIQDYQVHTR